MGKEIFIDIILYFTIYSILGFACEVIYCSVPEKRFVNRGFLAGPYCPIYGIGSIAVLLLLYPMSLKIINMPVLFFVAVIITSTIEYFTSWLMEKLFHLRWWDYSNYKFHINGRVCLLNSILFGLLSMFLLFILQPFVSNILVNVLFGVRMKIAFIAITVMFFDFITTLNRIYQLDNKFQKFKSSFITNKF